MATNRVNGRFAPTPLFNEEQQQFILNNYSEDITYDSLTKMFNEKYGTNFNLWNIRRFCYKVNGIKNYKHCFKYTEEMENWLKDNYGSNECEVKDIVERFNETFGTNVSKQALYSKCSKLNFHKPQNHYKIYSKEEKEWVKNNISSFESVSDCVVGFNKTFNKNITRTQLENFKKYHNIKTGRKPSTRFQKGQLTWNTKDIGTEKLKDNSNGSYTLLIKVGTNCWRAKKNIVWEQHNGEIPKGNIVIQLDGNPYNCEIENLRCVDKKTHTIMSLVYRANGCGTVTDAYIEVIKHKEYISKLKERE